MTRRDAFTGLRELIPAITEDGSQPLVVPAAPEKPGIKQPLDLIPTAQRRKKRNRDWEQIHQAETVTYRGIPKECHQWVEEISEGLSVPRDEVVRAFLEYGERQYLQGQLRMYAYPKSQRMTLFPDGNKSTSIFPAQTKEVASWLSDAFPVVTHKERGPKKHNSKSKADAPAWKIRVTYRIPVELKESIRTIATEHTLPVGEVVRFFIEHSVLAFRKGDLPLQPVAKLIGKTLFQDQKS